MPTRLIDTRPPKRAETEKPIRVLVLGLPRTGTSPLCIALRHLGYTTHTMRAVLTNPSHLALWQEAINLTLTPASSRSPSQRDLFPYTRSDFDLLFSGYDAVADLPGAVFAKELVEAYPDAKVILTRRPYEDWARSMRDSIGVLLTWRLFILCRYLGITQIAPLTRLMHATFTVHNGNDFSEPNARNAYERHYETVRSLVPATQLLDVDVAELDYDSLCSFLEVEKPISLGSFPQIEEDKGMRRGLESAWWSVVQFLVVVVLIPVLTAIVGLAIWLRQEDAARLVAWAKQQVDILFLQGGEDKKEL